VAKTPQDKQSRTGRITHGKAGQRITCPQVLQRFNPTPAQRSVTLGR
jgi:hypothetical protein